MVLAAFGLVVITGVLGLSIDMGYLRYTKRRMQTAADSAAIAAASELNGGNSTAAAINDAKVNGFEDGVNGASVTAFPPTDPPFAGLPNHIEVRVQQIAPTFFMRIFRINQAQISTTAVARLGTSKGCVYGLGQGPLGLLGGITVAAGTVSAPGCGVVDNSVLSLGGCINAASIGVALNLLGGCATPAPIVGIAPSADPLAYLGPPVPGACIALPPISVPAPTPATAVGPGNYCGGIAVAATNVAPINFAPGLYIVGAPGFTVAAGNTGAITGGGVTFYVTGGGVVGMQGGGNVTLTAPVDAALGGIPGVLFFQDRTDNNAANIQPTGILSLTGALYFANAPLTLGGNTPTAYTILVANSINFTGNFTIGTNYSALPDGSPIKSAVLVR
jgi:hypothetical protein